MASRKKEVFPNSGTNRPLLVLIFIAFVMLVLPRASFSSTSSEAETLRGVKALNVVVKARIGDEGAKGLGITQEQLQADVEQSLRQAGIRVAGNVRPYLLLSVSLFSISHPTVKGVLAYVYTAQLKFRQGAVLDSTGTRASVTTWDETRFGAATPTKDLDKRIRKSVNALVGAFVKDYLAENPGMQAP